MHNLGTYLAANSAVGVSSGVSIPFRIFIGPSASTAIVGGFHAWTANAFACTGVQDLGDFAAGGRAHAVT